MDLKRFESRMTLTIAVLSLCLLALPASAQDCWSDWQWSSPVPQGDPLRAVVSSGGMTVAVGGRGVIVSSADGIAWTREACPSQLDLSGVAAGPEGFVAVTDSPLVLTSEDGRDWRVEDTGRPAARLRAVAFGGGRFVAVGDGGLVLTSKKGHRWDARPAVTASDLNAVAWGGPSERELFVAVGSAGAVLTSVDGKEWTAAQTSDKDLFAVAWGGRPGRERFIAAGEGGTLLSSPDCAAWSRADSGTSYDLTAVAWGASRFVAAGASGTILSSCDGLAWFPDLFPAAPRLLGLVFAGDKFVAVGESGTVAVAAVLAVPTVTVVAPNTGPTSGGTNVTVTGTGFTTATAVRFGATPASSFVVNSDTQIGAFSPVHVSGVVDVTVTNPDGTSATGAADQFTYTLGVPVVTGVSPTSGPTSGGTTVTIAGAGFTGATAVDFGGTAATIFTVWSDGQIVAQSPARPAGTVHVTVTTGQGTSGATAADQYTYGAPAPTVTAINPTSGPIAGGTTVTVTGTNFVGGGTTVAFGANPATGVNVTSTTSLTCVSPAGTGTVHVTATTAGGTSATSAADQYTYTTTAPVVTGIVPGAGSTSGGTIVALAGTGFAGATAVYFGTTPAASFTIISGVQINATSPPHCAGDVHVTVTGPTGTSVATPSDLFTYNALLPAVTGVSPAGGPVAGGTSVAITGTDLFCATGVKFGANPASSLTVVSPTSITATSPAGVSAGIVDITVTTAGGTSTTVSADQFTYYPLPTVTAVNPATGAAAGGTAVTITGTGFFTPATVKFGTASATNVVIASATSITCTSPAGTAGSTVDVTVTTLGGTSAANAGDKFTYQGAPTVTGVSPSSGPVAGGTTVTVTGTGFVTGTGTTVKFGANPATEVNVASATSLTCKSPAGAPGQVDVYVTTSAGTSAAGTGSKFTYEATPTLTSLNPTTGPAAGGTSVTVSGVNFTGATAVKFGTTDAASYTVNSGIQITAVSPPGTGVVDVTVVTPNGTTAPSAASKFTYVSAPAITSVSPSKGSTLGQTQITILGSGFVTTGTTMVLVGNAAASQVTVVNPATITCVTPAHASGAADVKVTNPDGQSVTKTGAFTFIPPPVITAIKKLTDPFRLKITGTNFHTNCTVRINGVAVPTTQFKESTRVFAKGGATLKAMLPPGVTVQITVVNNDDGITSLNFPYQR